MLNLHLPLRPRLIALVCALAFAACGGGGGASDVLDAGTDTATDAATDTATDAATDTLGDAGDSGADTADGDDATDDTADSGLPARNRCGGTERLLWDGAPATPGDVCGCGGLVVCVGRDAVECLGATPPNACGSCGTLEGTPDAPCGRCGDGTWACEEGELVCDGGNDGNLCGGCEPLDERPGAVCDSPDGVGIWACEGEDATFCVGDGRNACGGFGLLPALPSVPCGPCLGGTYVCNGRNDVVCRDEQRRVNACDGCGPLPAELGSACACGGEWICDDLTAGRLLCDDTSTNACGGCDPLDGPPGQTCDDDAIWFCASPDVVACSDTPDINACGGIGPLDNPPGDACGPCGAGQTVCITAYDTACVGAVGRNACGGCGNERAVPGLPCATGAAWKCVPETGELACIPGDGNNPCGGRRDLRGVPGDTCSVCGVWACEGLENVRCVANTDDPECALGDPELCEGPRDEDDDGLTNCDDPDCFDFPFCGVPDREAICDDGRDGDLDRLVDCADPDCAVDPACVLPSSEICLNGIDDDDDGRVDCDDPDCSRSPVCRVEVCDNGRDDDGNGEIDCFDAACAGASVCDFEFDCTDGEDDDGDSRVDCDDADCAGHVSCPPVELCNNGADDDGDLLADCDDPYCYADTRCDGFGAEICDDGDDNDDDRLTDCADPECATDDHCVAETDCDDMVDNDEDGHTDCEDLGCVGDPVCAAVVEVCDDDTDNDDDDLVDCHDPQCVGADVCIDSGFRLINGASSTGTVSMQLQRADGSVIANTGAVPYAEVAPTADLPAPFFDVAPGVYDAIVLGPGDTVGSPFLRETVRIEPDLRYDFVVFDSSAGGGLRWDKYPREDAPVTTTARMFQGTGDDVGVRIEVRNRGSLVDTTTGDGLGTFAEPIDVPPSVALTITAFPPGEASIEFAWPGAAPGRNGVYFIGLSDDVIGLAVDRDGNVRTLQQASNMRFVNMLEGVGPVDVYISPDLETPVATVDPDDISGVVSAVATGATLAVYAAGDTPGGTLPIGTVGGVDLNGERIVFLFGDGLRLQAIPIPVDERDGLSREFRVANGLFSGDDVGTVPLAVHEGFGALEYGTEMASGSAGDPTGPFVIPTVGGDRLLGFDWTDDQVMDARLDVDPTAGDVRRTMAIGFGYRDTGPVAGVVAGDGSLNVVDLIDFAKVEVIHVGSGVGVPTTIDVADARAADVAFAPDVAFETTSGNQAVAPFAGDVQATNTVDSTPFVTESTPFPCHAGTETTLVVFDDGTSPAIAVAQAAYNGTTTTADRTRVLFMHAGSTVDQIDAQVGTVPTDRLRRGQHYRSAGAVTFPGTVSIDETLDTTPDTTFSLTAFETDDLTLVYYFIAGTRRLGVVADGVFSDLAPD